MINHTMTERYLTDFLPEMITASPAQAVDAYCEYNLQVGHVVGDASQPGDSNFSWQVLHELIGEKDEGSALSARVAKIAQYTKVPTAAYPIRAILGTSLRLHSDGGSLLVVSAIDGRPIAASSVHNPEVPGKYGSMDPYVLAQIGEAALVEKLARQGADWGEGYALLTDLKQSHGLLARDSKPHIGMATIHEQSYDADTPGADRRALAYAGTSGRTMNTAFREYIVRHRPDYVAPTVTAGERADPDDLAGFIDTVSGMVACRAAVYPAATTSNSMAVGWETDWRGIMESGWPDPNHPDNADVDWN